MTWRRSRWWLLGLFLALLLSLSLWLIVDEPHAITEVNSQKIQPGMSLEEVDAMLGAGHQRSRMPAGGGQFICCYSEDDRSSVVPREVIAVVFDGQGQVVEKKFVRKGPNDAPRRLRGRFREWLGL